MATTGKRSEGSILQLDDDGDRWLVRISFGLVHGRRVRESRVIRGRKRDAERYLRSRLKARDDGGAQALTRQSVAALVADHFELWSGDVAPQTLARNRENWTRYGESASWLAARRAADLSPRDVQRWIEELSGRGLAANTVRGVHSILRVALSRAVERGELVRNVAKMARVPRGDHREMRALSPEEARALLAEAEGDDLRALWLVLVTCGLRPSEALGLRWVDLDGLTLRVRRSLVRVGRRLVLEKTKTGRERSLPLGGSVVRALAAHKRSQNEERLKAGELYADQGLVFATRLGGPIDLKNLVHRSFRPLVMRTALRLAGEASAPPPPLAHRVGREAGRAYDLALTEYREAGERALASRDLGRLRLYDLRHSAATLMLANGEHPKVVAERLGHANVTLTLNTYSHVTPTMQAQAADRLEALLKTGTEGEA